MDKYKWRGRRTKRYERTIKVIKDICKVERSAEQQAVGMVIANVLHDHNIDIDSINIDHYVLRFETFLDWLNEEEE